MANQNPTQPAGPPELPRFLPLLLLLFVGSGCSALIYEIVWFQLLQLVIGSSAVSLAVLLGTFMGGMCLGSLGLPRMISRRRHPLRVYALLELGTGIAGVVVLFVMPYVDRLYISNVVPGLPGILLRGAVVAVCLLPPTLLMGATLPAIARWIEATPRGVSWLGFFYAGNIAGAVLGCLTAGFYLLRVYDMATATYVAATINGAASLIALELANLTPYRPSSAEAPAGPVPRVPALWSVYLTIALSGLSALSAEVVWTRLLSLMLGPTVYTFSIILAVFLTGLGIGSALGSFLARAAARPRLALGVCQMLLAAAIAWAAFMLAHSVPYWPIDPALSSSPWFNFQLDLLRCGWVIFPATCLWGASFPLALASVASRQQDAGRLVAGVYAVNTVGAVVGAVTCSLFLIPRFGTQQAQRVLIAISALAALLMLVPQFWPSRAQTASGAASNTFRRGIAAWASLTALIAVAALLAWSVSGVPWGLVADGRSLLTAGRQSDVIFVGEGMNASVAVSETVLGDRHFHISGKVEASTVPADMRLQRMLGHVPALLHPKPRSVLIVGCGAGITAGSFVLYPDVEKIVICEIEPLVPSVAAMFFDGPNNGVLEDPRVQVVCDDARHYLLTTQDQFDIITSDPIHPWVKGSATLYTQEYFELCRRHLNPGGLVTQWVPLYESTADVVESEIATFFAVFSAGIILENNDEGLGYDLVLLGIPAGTKIDLDQVQSRLDQPEHAGAAESLNEVELDGALSLFKSYLGRASDLQPWLEGAEINRDRNLRLQYLAGMSLNAVQGRAIHDQILSYRKYPEDLFVGSRLRTAALRFVLTHQPAGK
jgi:spermidine synthase